MDTSAVLAVLLNEPERPGILRATKGSLVLAAPSLPWEVGNALIALLRRKRLDGDAVQRAWAAYQKMSVRLVDIDVSEALRLAEAHGVYAYDAYVLEAARGERARLVTLDRPLQRAARACGVEVEEVMP